MSGELIAYNDNFATGQDFAIVDFTMPSVDSLYEVVVANKLYTPGTGVTKGALSIGVTWNAQDAGVNIPLDTHGDGSGITQIFRKTDSSFFKIVAPADSAGTVTIAAQPDSTLDGDLYIITSFQPVRFSAKTGKNVAESVTMNGVAPGAVLYVTVQSKGFATTGYMPITVNFATGAPPTPTAAPDLPSSADTGISNTDNLTYRTTPSFSIPFDSQYAGFYGRIYVDGTLYGGPTQLSTTSITTVSSSGRVLADGPHTVQWKLSTGNVSPQSGLSPTLNIVVDATAPVLQHAEFELENEQRIQFVSTKTFTAPRPAA